MIGHAISKNKVKIRLTGERWFHITESHDYMSGLSDSVLESVNDPEEIIDGDEGEKIAIKRFNNKYMVTMYRETDVLYVYFEKPQNADNSIMEGNTIIHKRGNRIVGMTIINASKYRAG